MVVSTVGRDATHRPQSNATRSGKFRFQQRLQGDRASHQSQSGRRTRATRYLCCWNAQLHLRTNACKHYKRRIQSSLTKLRGQTMQRLHGWSLSMIGSWNASLDLRLRRRTETPVLNRLGGLVLLSLRCRQDCGNRRTVQSERVIPPAWQRCHRVNPQTRNLFGGLGYLQQPGRGATARNVFPRGLQPCGRR